MGVKLTKEWITSLKERLPKKIQQYKFPVLILAAGMVLLLLPVKSEQTEAATVTQNLPEAELEVRMEELISQIDGAGSVQVLLTLESGTENLYQQDHEQRIRDDESERQSTTVLVSDNGNEVPVIIKTKHPVYKGAVVVCTGADSAVVRLNIVRAVSSLTGLGSDKITVVKMKG